MQEEDNQDKKTYRNILKGTAVFGGVQVFNILITLVRGKLIALILGPSGMGVAALFNSSTSLIQQLASFGLNLSAIKDISRTKEKSRFELFRTVTIFRKLLILSAILGGVLTILFSGYLCKLNFGDYRYRWGFVCLSVFVFFTILSNGEAAILQGCRSLKKLAYATLLGSLLGLVIGVPLYYFFGVNGIVPAMILLSLCTFAFNKYNVRKLGLKKTYVGKGRSFIVGKGMLSLGVVSMLSALLGSAAYFLLNAYISNYGSITDVGLYQAASSITNQYIGLVFSAMSVDFFPRLAAVSDDNMKVKEMVNQQTEVVLLIITPLLILLIITAPFLIRLLLSSEFIETAPLVKLIAVAVFFKAMVFPMGYISFSKGDKKFFFWFEGVYGNVFVLLMNIVCYSFWGLVGLGVSVLVSYFVFFVSYIVATKVRYSFAFNLSFIKLLICCLGLLSLAYALSYWNELLYSYIIMVACLIISSFLSYKELDKRMDISGILRSFIKRK